MKTDLHQTLTALSRAYHQDELSKEDYRRQRRRELEALAGSVEHPADASLVSVKHNYQFARLAVMGIAASILLVIVLLAS